MERYFWRLFIDLFNLTGFPVLMQKQNVIKLIYSYVRHMTRTTIHNGFFKIDSLAYL